LPEYVKIAPDFYYFLPYRGSNRNCSVANRFEPNVQQVSGSFRKAESSQAAIMAKAVTVRKSCKPGRRIAACRQKQQ
jgi:hypothetical protein